MYSVIAKCRVCFSQTRHFAWRRRSDLNARAAFATYSLSRGAPSPLGYFSVKYGGEEEIRTLGSFESPVFKTGSLNRSDTSPFISAFKSAKVFYHKRPRLSIPKNELYLTELNKKEWKRGLTNGSPYGIISEQTAKRRFFKDKPDPPEKTQERTARSHATGRSQTPPSPRRRFFLFNGKLPERHKASRSVRRIL